jgi:hypothetical protein
LLPEDELLKYDWLVARMLTSEIPVTRTSTGVLYLNADPDSFRVITAVVSGVSTFNDDELAVLYNSKGTCWQLLILTAKYLGSTEIVERMESFEGIGLLQKKIRDLEAQLVALNGDLTNEKAEHQDSKRQCDESIEGGLASAPDLLARRYACAQCGYSRRNAAFVFSKSDAADDWTFDVTCPYGHKPTGFKVATAHRAAYLRQLINNSK